MSQASRMRAAAFSAYTTSWELGVILAIYFLLSGLVISLNPRSIQTRPALDLGAGRIATWWKQAQANSRGVTALLLISRGELNNDSNDVFSARQPGSPLRVPGVMPKLKHLTIIGDLSNAALTEILEFQQLDSMTLLSMSALGAESWRAISRQPLKSLEIQSANDQILDAAQFPAQLEKLLIRNLSFGLPSKTPNRMQPLRGLNQLRVLEIHLWQEAGGLNPEERDVLAQLPSLNTLYVSRYSRGAIGIAPEDFIAQTQSELPRVCVRPAEYESNRLWKVLTLTVLGTLPLIVILYTLSLQFASPAARLTPHYLQPHFQVAGILFAVMVVIQTLFLAGAHCNPLAAIALASSCAFSGCAPMLSLGQRRQLPGYTNLAMASLPLLIQAGIVTFAGFLAPAETDWFFAGRRTDIAALLFALGLIGIGLTVRMLVQLSRILAEQFPSTAPFDVWNPQRFSHWYLEGQPDGRQNFIWRLNSRGQSRRLNRISQTAHHAPGRQVALWRASQGMTAIGFIVMWGTYMSVFTVSGSLFSASMGTSPWLMFVMSMVQFAGACLMAPFIVLVTQRNFYARHLLMSLDRRAWVRLMFREAANDFIPAAIMSIVGLVALSIRHPADVWPTWQVAILAAAALALVYAIQLILATYPMWVMIVAGSAAVASPFLIIALIAPKTMEEGAQNLQAVSLLYWPVTWWCIVMGLAVLALRFAYHRWMTWELGKTAS